MTRQFKIQTLLSESAGSNLVDIPHLGLLRYLEPKRIKTWFKDKWGTEPKGIVLPVAHPEGLLFKVDGLDEPISPYAQVSENLKEFQDVVQVFAQQGLDIYLLINPTLEFVRAAPLHIINIVGDGSHALCIGNSMGRAIVAAILGTGVDITRMATRNTPGKLAGVVLDVVNLFPMGAKNERLELTCFCPSCEEWFEANDPGLLRNFRAFPNPWNLLLQDSGTGIGFIDDVRLGSQPEDIVGLSRQKGFNEIFKDKANDLPYLREQAALLLRYMRVRHDQVIASVRDIFDEALHGLEQMPNRILLVEGSYYGWTSGLQLEDLDRTHLDRTRSEETRVPYDEIWFDPAATDMFLTNVPFRSYMWRRARYYIDEFLRAVDSVSDPVKRVTTGVARFPRAAAQALLRQRLHQSVGTAMTGSSTLIALPPLKSEQTKSQRIGFVGVALTQEIGDKFIEGVKIPEGLAEVQLGRDLGDLFELLARSTPKAGKEGSKSAG